MEKTSSFDIGVIAGMEKEAASQGFKDARKLTSLLGAIGGAGLGASIGGGVSAHKAEDGDRLKAALKGIVAGGALGAATGGAGSYMSTNAIRGLVRQAPKKQNLGKIIKYKD